MDNHQKTHIVYPSEARSSYTVFPGSVRITKSVMRKGVRQTNPPRLQTVGVVKQSGSPKHAVTVGVVGPHGIRHSRQSHKLRQSSHGKWFLESLAVV